MTGDLCLCTACCDTGAIPACHWKGRGIACEAEANGEFGCLLCKLGGGQTAYSTLTVTFPWNKNTLKIAPSSPRNSLFIGHASNPPYPYQNTTKSIKFGLKIILIHLTSIINFNYSIPFSICHNFNMYVMHFTKKIKNWYCLKTWNFHFPKEALWHIFLKKMSQQFILRHYIFVWPFYLKFNLSKTIHFLKRPWFLYVLSKYQAMFKVLQWNARLWKIPTLKIAHIWLSLQ
jgi:hypothetical protein